MIPFSTRAQRRTVRAAATAATAALAAVLLAGGCEPRGRQVTDGGLRPTTRAEARDPARNANQDSVDTEWGPLTPADRTLIVRIREAALWRVPTGRAAADRAAGAATRRNLGEIARLHARLDARARRAAARLGMTLPDRPTARQRSWMSEISGKSGLAYDRTVVARMRAADGRLYPLVAAVRATTANTLVRGFAAECETSVAAGLKLLEDTGLVTEDMLPDPPDVARAPEAPNPNRTVPSAPPAGAAGLTGP